MNEFAKNFNNNRNDYESTETGKTLLFGAKIFGTTGMVATIVYQCFKHGRELIKIFSNKN